MKTYPWETGDDWFPLEMPSDRAEIWTPEVAAQLDPTIHWTFQHEEPDHETHARLLGADLDHA